VRYDVTDTVDNLGNDVWGYALIEEEPFYTTNTDNPDQDQEWWFSIIYHIDEFMFASTAGNFSGNSGFLNFYGCVNCNLEKTYLPAQFVSTSDAWARFNGDSDTWDNVATGIWFYNGDERVDWIDVDTYLVLPEEIGICTYMFFSPYIEDGEWYVGWGLWDFEEGDDADYLTLTRSTQPVPEPATIFLLVSGLIGIGRFRKKFRN